MKNLFLFIAIQAMVLSAAAQTELSAFNLTGSAYSTTAATDYQSLGINPANLGWTSGDRSITLGFLESAFSIYAEPLTRKQVIQDLFNNSTNLSMEERNQAALNFTDKRLSGNASITWLGFSYQDDKIGGFAFAIRDRITWSSVLNDYASSFLFLGYHDPYFDSLAVNGQDTIGYSTDPQNASLIYQGSSQNFLWTREFNLGYGRIIINKENVKWYGGIDVKYMNVYAGAQYHNTNMADQLGFSALSPLFDVEYDSPTPSQISGSGLKKVGWGWGINIGTTVQLYNNLKIAVALNEIGQINYNGNVYEARDTRVWKMTTSGLENYNIFSQGQLITVDNPPNDSSFWHGLKTKSYSLPMSFRGGASYRIIKQVEIGTDIVLPITKDVPGVYEKLIFCFGGKYAPADWVELSMGVVSGGLFGTNMPFGVTFFPMKKETTWQVGFATRDLITLFNSQNPTVSFAVGFMRFGFGSKHESTTKKS